MAFFGVQNSGGLFGLGGQQTPTVQIVGIDPSLIAASTDAKLAQLSLASLSASQRSAQFSSFRNNDPAVIPPWQLPEESQTLSQKIREVRELSNFIDLRDDSLDAVSDDPDQKATFVLFNALTNLRVLAEYAAEDNTSEASLERLDDQFQLGLGQVKDYLSETELDKLELFLGDKEYKTEASTRTGKNSTTTNGGLVAASADDVITGLTGTEVFTVSITKSGVTDDIQVDLSGISGDLTLRSISEHINAQIELVTDIDDEGETFIKHQTRINFQRDGDTGQYGLQIEGTITEEVKLSAAASEPTLYAVSTNTQLDDSFAVTSRITEFNGLSGTITQDDTTSFAAIDYAETEIATLLAEQEDDDLDPEIASLRDKFLADAKTDVLGNDDETNATDDVDNASSITNINTENRVNADTLSSRVAVDSDGGIYVVGSSKGSFGHQLNVAEEQDVFLTKFDTEGNVVFSRLLGVSGSAEAYDIKIDSQDNVIIAGATDSALQESDAVDSANDAFIVKYSKRGDEIFRYQLDTFGTTKAYSVAVDASDNIFVGGSTSSAISASSGFAGGNDALILKLDGTNGALLDSNVFGTSESDVIKGIAVDQNGDLVAAVQGGTSNNVSVYRISGTDLTNQTTSIDLGDLGTAGTLSSVSIDTTNSKIYLSGTTTNMSLDAAGTATVNGTADGGLEGFVSGLSYSGTNAISADFTTYVSTTGTDRIADVTVQNGTVYVAGSTNNSLAGETSVGTTDGFVSKINGTTGVVEDSQQYGESLSATNVGGIAFTTHGNSVLEKLGLPTGLIAADETRDLQTQTTARPGDHFFMKIGSGTRIRIELDEGDGFDDIARQIRIAGFGKLDVDVSSTSEGSRLRISALDDGLPITFTAGNGDQDLLSRIGLEAGKLLPKNEVFDINLDDDIKPEEDLGGAFGLKLGGALHVRDKATARYVLGLLDTAISTTQRAFRSTFFDPIKAQLLAEGKNNGPVPPRIAAQIANLQTGLQRLQSGAGSPSLSLFA